MWVLVVNGLVYLTFIYLHGEWRDLVPRRGDARDAIEMIKFYLFVTKAHPHQGKHNAMQKATYFAMPVLAHRAGAHGTRDLEAGAARLASPRSSAATCGRATGTLWRWSR